MAGAGVHEYLSRVADSVVARPMCCSLHALFVVRSIHCHQVQFIASAHRSSARRRMRVAPVHARLRLQGAHQSWPRNHLCPTTALRGREQIKRWCSHMFVRKDEPSVHCPVEVLDLTRQPDTVVRTWMHQANWPSSVSCSTVRAQSEYGQLFTADWCDHSHALVNPSLPVLEWIEIKLSLIVI